MTLREQYAAAVTRGRDLARARQHRGPILTMPGPEPPGVRVRDLGEAPRPVADRDWRKQQKGFAVMDPAQVRAIARLGGVAVQAKGTAHRWTREEAHAAGRKSSTRWTAETGAAAGAKGVAARRLMKEQACRNYSSRSPSP